MIHFLPMPDESQQGSANAELMLRMSGLKRALRLADPFGGGPASDMDDALDAAGLASASDEIVRCFDRRSERHVAGAAAGLEALAAQHGQGREPNSAALDMLAREIRSALADLSSLVRA